MKCLHRTLMYCVWKLMIGDEEQESEMKERVALPPPVKRRDIHMRMFYFLFHFFLNRNS